MRSPIRSPRVYLTSPLALLAKIVGVLSRIRVFSLRGSFVGEGRGWSIREISRDHCGSIVVIAGVEDQADGVPHATRSVSRTPSSSSNNTSASNTGRSKPEFGRLHRIVVGILYLFQQFAVVVKKAGASLWPISSLRCRLRDGSYHSRSADQQQPSALHAGTPLRSETLQSGPAQSRSAPGKSVESSTARNAHISSESAPPRSGRRRAPATGNRSAPRHCPALPEPASILCPHTAGKLRLLFS